MGCVVVEEQKRQQQATTVRLKKKVRGSEKRQVETIEGSSGGGGGYVHGRMGTGRERVGMCARTERRKRSRGCLSTTPHPVDAGSAEKEESHRAKATMPAIVPLCSFSCCLFGRMAGQYSPIGLAALTPLQSPRRPPPLLGIAPDVDLA